MAKEAPFAEQGEILRTARARLNLTQQEIADQLDRKQAQISRWESGEQLPPTQDVRKVASVYRIKPEQLLPRKAS